MSASELGLFLCRRLAALLASLVAVSAVVFALTYIAPGSPEQTLAGVQGATPELLAKIREQHGLDDPILEQYGRWLTDALTLDFGRSLVTRESVAAEIARRLPLSIELIGSALVLAVAVGLPLGVASARRRGTAIDRGVVFGSVLGLSAPAFATGTLFLYTLGYLAGWFPTFGQGASGIDRAHHLVLPVLALALTGLALIVRVTRASMLSVLGEDYITFARARGLTPRHIVARHALRNALVPVVTAASVVFGSMLAGAVLVEATFALPGIGTLLVEAIDQSDIPTIQGLSMLFALLIIGLNLVVDLLYFLIDPRIRPGRARA